MSSEFLFEADYLLSADDLEAIERANTDLQRLKSQGSDLSDVEHGLVVRPYSEKAYGHVAAFEEAITRLYLSLPRSIQEAIDQVLKDKATLDFSELEDHQRLVDYAILASETFNTLKRNEQDMLARAFPNYATLFRDPDFWAISGHGTNQRQAAEHFIGKLIGNRRHRL
ncbi:hypothetical protein QR680_014767 [Steinernema hermaphroditum]|uniref:Uncharacterized protein n=1 Tax=Steinernema hermaphroditum TaxID=289476 RepID=A0AA39M4G7_9BILA|nr:hypothetical protein QR680_014767 [Steinernema hermaphroditum]